MSTDSGSGSDSPAKSEFVPPSTADLDAILDQYEFLELIGRGGMGAVYKARQKNLDRLVAIKILPPHLTTDVEEEGFRFAERFQREARAMAKMSHPHIVGVYSFGQAKNGQFYFVMEYVEGTDLNALIKGGQMTIGQVEKWMNQICEALQYAHEKGIIHRDIKPANIMITREGQVKVADFGLAKLSGGEVAQTKLTMTNMAMGTPDYVAPEVFDSGVEVDHRVDLYALGVMLYEMLTGRVPRGNWKPPSEAKPGTDPRYDDLVAKAMEADRKERFQQASEISATIYQIANTPPPGKTSRPKPAVGAKPRVEEKAHRPRRRSPSTSVPESARKEKSPVGIMVGILAIIGLGGFFWLKPMLFPPVQPTPATEPSISRHTPEPGSTPGPAIPQPKGVPSPTPKPKPAKPELTNPEPKPAIVTTVAPPETIDTSPWTDAIALLTRVDLAKDAKPGAWRVQGTDLISREKSNPALLELPVIPPEEYDLRVRFTKNGGSQNVFVVLSRGDRSFLWSGGADSNRIFGFGHHRGGPQLTDLKTSNPGLQTVSSCFETGRAYTVQISVRKTGAKAFLDGTKVSDLPADLGEMQTPDAFDIDTPGALGIGTFKTEYAIHSIELREISGKAKLLREAPAPATTPAMTTTPPAPPVSTDPVTLRLTELEKAFLAAFEAQVVPKHDAAVANLNTNYLARLDRDIAAASKGGKLEEALALRDERTQIETHGILPAEDPATLAPALKPLRATYRSTMTTLLKQRDLAAAPLYATYDRTLAAYQDELTKTQQLDQATRVKAVREHVVTQRESTVKPASTAEASADPTLPPVGQKSIANAPPVPVAPPLPASQVLPLPPKASQEDIRAFVDWLLRFKQNKITIAEGPLRREINQSADLPRGNIRVVALYFHDLGQFPKNDETQRNFTTFFGLTDLESLSIATLASVLPVESLRGLTRLKILRLRNGTLDESGFAHLSGLKELIEVGITNIKGFTGTGLGYLGEGIVDLQLPGNPHLTAEGMTYLARFRKLRRLELFQCPTPTDEMLRPLAALNELESLEVYSTPLDCSFLALLPDNSKIKFLDLGDLRNANPEFLVHLARLKNLETIGLPPLDLPRDVMAVLARLGKLQKLSVSHPFTGETLADVTGFRSLTDLDLKESPVTDAGWAAIVQAMPELKSITLFRPAGSTAPQNAAAMGEQIGRLKNLGFLNFGGPTFTDDWLLAASRAKNLGGLFVSSPLVTDAGLVHLQDLPLTGLRINGTSITDASLPTLKKFPKLIGGYIYFPEKMSPEAIAEVKAHCDNRKK